MKKLRILAALSVASISFLFPFLFEDNAFASCVNAGQIAAIAAAAQADTSTTTTVQEIETCGGDDDSYRVPITATVTFDGETFTSVYATTNSVITFGRPDGTYWDYPRTPSISLYSMDWLIMPSWNQDEHFVIRTSDGGFQVDLSARPYVGYNAAAEPTNIIVTAAINVDGTVAISYVVSGPTYDGATRTGVRLIDGRIVSLEEYGVQRVEVAPTLAPTPEPTPTETATPAPTPDGSTATATPEPSPTETPSPTASPTPEPTSSPEPTPYVPFFPENSVHATGDEWGEITLTAPEGNIFSGIYFANYGLPIDYQVNPECSTDVTFWATAAFIGHSTGTIQVTNVPVYGDPCPGIGKHMSLIVLYTPGQDSSTVLNPEPSPSPTPSESETASAQPEPSTSPSPEPTPSPTPSPEPSVAPSREDNQQPAPVQTPQPDPAPTPSTDPSPTPSPDPTPDPTPVVDPTPTPQETPQPEPSPEPTQDPAPNPEPTDQPTPPAPSPAPSEPPVTEPETPKNQLPPVAKDVPPQGGQIIYGTKEQPQVIDPDTGKLTPPPPPPGSGLPIPPDAITVAETFIGQPGGMSLNSPDVAVPIVATPVELPAALDAIPGLGDAAQALSNAYVAIANIGADMSPSARKKGKKIVVAALLVQQAIGAATRLGRK